MSADPTYADGIEAAARVADEARASTLNEAGDPWDAGYLSAAEGIAERIRALAPERGGGSENLTGYAEFTPITLGSSTTPVASAPGGESGWHPIKSAPRDGTDILLSAEATASRRARYGVGSYGTDGLLWDWGWTFSPTHWQPLPAPPGAPPVSAPPAESGDKFLLPDDKAARYSWEFVKHIADKSRKEAEAKCRELEGEVARKDALLKKFTDGCPFTGRPNDETSRLGPTDPCPACGMLGTVDAENKCVATSGGRIAIVEARADRVTAAAQAARDALERLAQVPTNFDTIANMRQIAREALASLVAVLPGSGGAE